MKRIISSLNSETINNAFLDNAADINPVRDVLGCKDRELLEKIKTRNLYDGFYLGRDFEAAVEIMKEKGLQIDLFEPEEVFDIQKLKIFSQFICIPTRRSAYCFCYQSGCTDERKADFDNDDFDEVPVVLKNIKDSFTTCKEQSPEMVTFTR